MTIPFIERWVSSAPADVVILLVLAVHWLADFVFQSDWMALNKSKNNDALLLHVSIYAACFLWLGVGFVAVTFICHALTDFVTSRLNARLWATGERHWFFVAIGFDQVLHFTQLILTLRVR